MLPGEQSVGENIQQGPGRHAPATDYLQDVENFSADKARSDAHTHAHAQPSGSRPAVLSRERQVRAQQRERHTSLC